MRDLCLKELCRLIADSTMRDLCLKQLSHQITVSLIIYEGYPECVGVSLALSHKGGEYDIIFSKFIHVKLVLSVFIYLMVYAKSPTMVGDTILL